MILHMSVMLNNPFVKLGIRSKYDSFSRDMPCYFAVFGARFN